MSELSNLIFHNKKHALTSPYGPRKVMNTSAGKTSGFHDGVDYGTYGVKLPQYPVGDGILSSDGSIIWHVEGLPEFPEGLCQTVIVEKLKRMSIYGGKKGLRLTQQTQMKLSKSRLQPMKSLKAMMFLKAKPQSKPY